MPDTQAYLDELYAKRAAQIGIKNSTFSDQSTTFDLDGLNAEIRRVEAAISTASGTSRTRYAATSKGV